VYRALGNSLSDALDYLSSTNLSNVSFGRHDIDGDRLFAIVRGYKPKPLSQIVWESHQCYIDVQYLVEGVEQMGCLNLGDSGMTVTVDNEEDDHIIYDAQGELFEVRGGTFVVYTPQDVHAPGLKPSSFADQPVGSQDRRQGAGQRYVGTVRGLNDGGKDKFAAIAVAVSSLSEYWTHGNRRPSTLMFGKSTSSPCRLSSRSTTKNVWA
jgi:YhcH/YjgK/YiaL family protein